MVGQYSDYVEFVGLCDINPGRVAFVKKYMGVNCPTFTDFDEMMTKVKPDMLDQMDLDESDKRMIDDISSEDDI